MSLIKRVVYLLTPTSNHNCKRLLKSLRPVVYLLTPTSNHNTAPLQTAAFTLYIFWLLHQTTTEFLFLRMEPALYIFWLLHQTTTNFKYYKKWKKLYIFWLLHQTTTIWANSQEPGGCISFDSYIKPQLYPLHICRSSVVYLLTPTSNHNLALIRKNSKKLYIFWLLHQTTTNASFHQSLLGCISFDSYIKPQLAHLLSSSGLVVYLLTPTSNHNRLGYLSINIKVVYLLTPTSNHNTPLYL